MREAVRFYVRLCHRLGGNDDLPTAWYRSSGSDGARVRAVAAPVHEVPDLAVVPLDELGLRVHGWPSGLLGRDALAVGANLTPPAVEGGTFNLAVRSA